MVKRPRPPKRKSPSKLRGVSTSERWAQQDRLDKIRKENRGGS